MSIFSWVKLNNLGDDRGGLVSIEGSKTIPFNVKRVYYIFGTKPGESRGFHAHKNLTQLMVCVSGSCRIILKNDQKIEEVILKEPGRGILIQNLVWREMHDFSDDCVLLVLASEYYDENDYVRDYQSFIDMIKSRKEFYE